MKPYFSIVIPLYNKERHIKNTIESVLNQTFEDFEIIIVNDGSTDRSAEVVKSIPDQRIKLFTTKNQGASNARNFGIDKATSEFVALLDADDYWYPFYLQEQKRLIDKYPEEFVFSTAQKILKYGKRYPCQYSIDFGEAMDGIVNYFQASLMSSIIHTSAVVIHKDVFKNIGLFNPKIESGQDTDLWIRIGLEYSVTFSKRICSEYVFIPDGLFKSTHCYALAIQSKLWNDNASFEALSADIELNNLNNKQRFLLKQNKDIIELFIKIKDSLSRLGIQLSAYK